MNYTEEDYNFIKNWLNKCVPIEKNNIIYYVTSKNIVRQLKYNRLLKEKKKIKVDLTKLIYKYNCILRQGLKDKYFQVNWEIWNIFRNKYDYYDNKNIINNILCDILNTNDYTSNYFMSYSMIDV